jgi:hypothetical protein
MRLWAIVAIRLRRFLQTLNMTHLAISVVLAISAIGVIAEPQLGKGGKGERAGGPTGLGALLGPDARPGGGCARLEVLIGWSKRISLLQHS